MKAFMRGLGKTAKYAAVTILIPYLLKTLHWLIELLVGDIALARLKNWVSEEKMLAWTLRLLSYVESYPLRSTAFIALMVLIACALGGYWESRKREKSFKTNAEKTVGSGAGLPSFPPVVTPHGDGYGKRADQTSYGLTITNSGYAAFDVHIPPVPIEPSMYVLVFPETVTHLGERDHKRFIAAWLEHPTRPGLDGGHLFDVMRTINIDSLKFAILYKDTQFRWYRSSCIFERRPEVPGGLRVRVLGQEVIPEPPITNSGRAEIKESERSPLWETRTTRINDESEQPEVALVWDWSHNEKELLGRTESSKGILVHNRSKGWVYNVQIHPLELAQHMVFDRINEIGPEEQHLALARWGEKSSLGTEYIYFFSKHENEEAALRKKFVYAKDHNRGLSDTFLKIPMRVTYEAKERAWEAHFNFIYDPGADSLFEKVSRQRP